MLQEMREIQRETSGEIMAEALEVLELKTLVFVGLDNQLSRLTHALWTCRITFLSGTLPFVVHQTLSLRYRTPAAGVSCMHMQPAVADACATCCMAAD